MGKQGAGERGAGGLEYVGATAVVAVILGMLLVGLPHYSPVMERAACHVARLTFDPGAVCADDDDNTQAQPSTPVPWFADTTMTPEERATRGNQAGLGDSYSSGEGGSSYVPGTDDDNQWKKWWDQHGLWPGDVHQNMCHRSTNAYSQRINSARGFNFKGFTFNACSGAVIEDFYTSNDQNHNADNPNRQNEGEPPQMQFVDENTSLITFSIGGNDVGFATVLQECVAATAWTVYDSISGAPASYCKDSQAAQDAANRVAPTAARLTQLLRDLRVRAPNARIIIVGYPKFFPDPPDPGQSMIQGADQTWINSQVEDLNAALAQAVQDAGGPAAGFEFVDVGDAFKGCEIGTKDSCMNGLRVGFGDNFDSGKPVSNGSFHPNDKGHDIIANLVAEQIRNGG